MDLEKEIAEIKERNQRVEADKAWETSLFRICSISVVIYVVASAFLYFIGANNFFLSALVPAIGYFLSVQSMPVLKRYWIETFLEKK